MLQQPCSTCFLHVYDVESGLWVHTMLDSGVSPRILGAMNAICIADGILAFSGTRSEFGLYLSKLKSTHGTDTRHCWTSLPASTVMSMLGLCLNMPMSGRPSLVFAGSPRTLIVAYLMSMKGSAYEAEETRAIESSLQSTGQFVIAQSAMESIQMTPDLVVSENDYEEALSYVVDYNHLEDDPLSARADQLGIPVDSISSKRSTEDEQRRQRRDEAFTSSISHLMK